MWRSLKYIGGLALWMGVSAAFGQSVLWGNLKPGEFGTGFHSRWIFDSSRTYHYRFSDGSDYGQGRTPRPILVNEWYPSAAKNGTHPMAESVYLDLDPGDGSPLGPFARELRRINEDIISGDVAEKPNRPALEAFLKTPMAAERDAAAAPGKFPVVIYIQGYGSSLQDNTGLCEFLASHGYIVLGSAYQDEKGHMIADRDTVCDDVKRLIEFARSIPGADLSHVALIGHSGGAQTALVYASMPGSIVDAVVSLDTTQDYYFNSRPSYKSYTDRVDAKRLTVPLLIAANSCAIFDLADTLVRSNRTYLKVDTLRHDEYTSEGLVTANVKHQTEAEGIRRRFSDQCDFILKFLDENLKQASSDLVHAPAHFEIESLSPGISHPPTYKSSPTPPTPRQFREIINQAPKKALDILKRFAKLRPRPAIMEGQLAFAVVDHFLDISDTAKAKQFAKTYNQVLGRDEITASIYLEWGQIYARNHADVEAIRNYERVLVFDPNNKVAKKNLDDLRKHPTS